MCAANKTFLNFYAYNLINNSFGNLIFSMLDFNLFIIFYKIHEYRRHFSDTQLSNFQTAEIRRCRSDQFLIK